MRTIKFRAWIKDKQKMIEWHPEFFSDMSEVTGYSSEFPDPEYVVLEQFTGLLDRNGKEIYENDRIKDLVYDCDYTCKFEDGIFGFYSDDGRYFNSESLQLNTGELDRSIIEIIGNIHS